MPLNLPYYYGHSGEQYAFFRIPKLLLTDDRFAEISTDAKLLYGLLLDRMELSYRNGWIDEQNRVFIIFTAEEVMSTLRCRSEKAARLFSELDSAKGIGLIERKRQGLGRPNIPTSTGKELPMKRNNVKQITIRLTADEYAHVKQLSKDSGLKMEPAIRRLIMGVNLRPRPPDELPELLRQLSGIGTNINQIAKVANASGYVRKEDIQSIMEMQAALWRAVKRG